MSSLNNIGAKLVVLFAIAITSSTASKEGKSSLIKDPNSRKWHIHIVHDMNPSKTLLVHCKSKDDYLGIHYINKGGEMAWGFRPNIIGTTLLWCYLAPDYNSHATFDVFWFDESLYEKCHFENCLWTAKDYGIYLLNILLQRQEFRVKWEHGSFNANQKA